MFYILFICFVFLVSKTTFAQVEMLQGGNMEDEAAWNVTHMASELYSLHLKYN